MDYVLLEEYEEEDLGALSRHYLKHAVELPVKAILFLPTIFNIPKIDQGSHLQVKQDYEHVFLKPRRIRVSIK
jgi:hypothetical protein